MFVAGPNVFVYDAGHRNPEYCSCLDKALRELISSQSVVVNGGLFSTFKPNLKSILSHKVIDQISVFTPSNIEPSACLESTVSSELERLPLDHPTGSIKETPFPDDPSISLYFDRKFPLVKHLVSYQTGTGQLDMSNAVDGSESDVILQIKHHCSVLVTGKTPINQFCRLPSLDKEQHSVFVVPHQSGDECISLLPEEARELLWNPTFLQGSSIHLAIYHKRFRFVPILETFKETSLSEKVNAFRTEYCSNSHPEADLRAMLQDADAKLTLFSEYNDKFYLKWFKRNKHRIFSQVSEAVSENEKKQYKRLVFLRNSLAWAHFYKHVNAEVYLMSANDLKQERQLEVLNGIALARFWMKTPCCIVITDSLSWSIDEIVQRDVRKLVFPKDQNVSNVQVRFIDKNLVRSNPFFTINPCAHIQHFKSEYHRVSVDPFTHTVSTIGLEPPIRNVKDDIDIIDEISTKQSNKLIGHIAYCSRPPPSKGASVAYSKSKKLLGAYMKDIGFKEKYGSYTMTEVLDCLIGPTLVQQLREIPLKGIPNLEFIPCLLEKNAASQLSSFFLSPTNYSATDADVVVSIRHPLQVGNQMVHKAKFIIKRARTMQLNIKLEAYVNSKHLRLNITEYLKLEGTCGMTVGDHLYNTSYKEEAWNRDIRRRTVGEILYVFLREENAVSAIQSLPLFLSFPLIKCKIIHYLTTVLVESETLQQAHIYVGSFLLEPVHINGRRVCIKITSLSMHTIKLDTNQHMINVKGNGILNECIEMKFTCYNVLDKDSRKQTKVFFVKPMPANKIFELFGVDISPSSLQHPLHGTALIDNAEYTGGFVLSQVFENTIESSLHSIFLDVESAPILKQILPPTCVLPYRNVTVKKIIDCLSTKNPKLGLEATFTTEVRLTQAVKSESKSSLECSLLITPSLTSDTYSSELVIRQSFSERNLHELSGPEIFTIVSTVDNHLGQRIEDQIKTIPKIGDQIWKNMIFRKIVCIIINHKIIRCEVHGALTKLDLIDNKISADNCTIKISCVNERVSINCSGCITFFKQFSYSVSQFCLPTLEKEGQISFNTYNNDMIFKDFLKEFEWLTKKIERNSILNKVLDTSIRGVVLSIHKNQVTNAVISVYRETIDIELLPLHCVDLEVSIKLVQNEYITAFSLQAFISDGLRAHLVYDPVQRILLGQVKVTFGRTVPAVSVLQLFRTSTTSRSYQKLKQALAEEFIDILSSDIKITPQPGLIASLRVSISLPSADFKQYLLRHLSMEMEDALKFKCENTYIMNSFHFEYISHPIPSKDSSHLCTIIHKLSTKENMSLDFDFKSNLKANVAAGPDGGFFKLCSAIDFAQAPLPEIPEFDVSLPPLFELELISGFIQFQKSPFQPAAFDVNILIKEWLLLREPNILASNISLKATWTSDKGSKLTFTDCFLVFHNYKFILSGELTYKDVIIKGSCSTESDTLSKSPPVYLQSMLNEYTPSSAMVKPVIPTEIGLPSMLVELTELRIHIQELSESFRMNMVVVSQPVWTLDFGDLKIPICKIGGALEWKRLKTKTDYEAYIYGTAKLFGKGVEIKMLLEESDKDSIIFFPTIKHLNFFHYSQVIDHLLNPRASEIKRFNIYDPSTSGLSELVPSVLQDIHFTEASSAFNFQQKQFFFRSKVSGWGSGSILIGLLLDDQPDDIDYVVSLCLDGDISFSRLSNDNTSLAFVDDLVCLTTTDLLISSANFHQLLDIATKFKSISESWVGEKLPVLPFYESLLVRESKLAENSVVVGTTVYGTINISQSQGVISNLLRLGDTLLPNNLFIVTFIGRSEAKTDLIISAWVPKILLFGMLEFLDIRLQYNVKNPQEFELAGLIVLSMNGQSVLKFCGKLLVNSESAIFNTTSRENSVINPCKLTVVAENLNLELKMHLEEKYPNVFVGGYVKIEAMELACKFIFVGIEFQVFEIALEEGLQLATVLECCSVHWTVGLDIIVKEGKLYYASSEFTLDQLDYKRGHNIKATLMLFKHCFEMLDGNVDVDKHDAAFDARALQSIDLDFAKLIGEIKDTESDTVVQRHDGPLLSYKDKALTLSTGLEILDIPCSDGELKCMPNSDILKGEIRCLKFLWTSEPKIQLEWSQKNSFQITELKLLGDVPKYSLLKLIEDVSKIQANSISGTLSWDWELCLKTVYNDSPKDYIACFIISGNINVSVIELIDKKKFKLPSMQIYLPRDDNHSKLLSHYILEDLNRNSSSFIGELLDLLDPNKYFWMSRPDIRASIKGTTELVDIVATKFSEDSDPAVKSEDSKSAAPKRTYWRGMYCVYSGSAFIIDNKRRMVLGYICRGIAGKKLHNEDYTIEQFGAFVTVNAISSMAHEIHKHLKSCVDAQKYRTEESEEVLDDSQELLKDLKSLKSKANDLTKTLTVVADGILTVTDVDVDVVRNRKKDKFRVVVKWLTYNPEKKQFYTEDKGKGDIEYHVKILAVRIIKKKLEMNNLCDDIFTINDAQCTTKESTYDPYQVKVKASLESSVLEASIAQERSTLPRYIRLVTPFIKFNLKELVCINVCIQPRVSLQVKMLPPDKIVERTIEKEKNPFGKEWMDAMKKQIEASGRLLDVTINGKMMSKQHIPNVYCESSDFIEFTTDYKLDTENLTITGTITPVNEAQYYIVQLVDTTNQTVIMKQSLLCPSRTIKYVLKALCNDFPETSSGPYCVSILPLNHDKAALSSFVNSKLKIVRYNSPEYLLVELPNLDRSETNVKLKWRRPSSEESLADESEPLPSNDYSFHLTITAYAVKSRQVDQTLPTGGQHKKSLIKEDSKSIEINTQVVHHDFNLSDLLKSTSKSLKHQNGVIFRCKIVTIGKPKSKLHSKLQSMPKFFPDFILLSPPKNMKVFTRKKRAELHISWEYVPHAIGYRLEIVVTKSQEKKMSKDFKCGAGGSGLAVLCKNDFRDIPCADVDESYQLRMYSLGLGEDLIRCVEPTVLKSPDTLHVIPAQLGYLQEKKILRVTFGFQGKTNQSILRTVTSAIYKGFETAVKCTVGLYQSSSVMDKPSSLLIKDVRFKISDGESVEDFALEEIHQKLQSGSVITAWVCSLSRAKFILGLPQEKILVLESPILKTSFTYHLDGSIHQMKVVWSDIPGSVKYEYVFRLLKDKVILNKETNETKILIDFTQAEYKCLLKQLLLGRDNHCQQCRLYVTALGDPKQLLINALAMDVHTLNYMIIPSSKKLIVFATNQLQKIWTSFLCTNPVKLTFDQHTTKQKRYLVYKSVQKSIQKSIAEKPDINSPFPNIRIPKRLREKFWNEASLVTDGK